MHLRASLWSLFCPGDWGGRWRAKEFFESTALGVSLCQWGRLALPVCVCGAVCLLGAVSLDVCIPL